MITAQERLNRINDPYEWDNSYTGHGDMWEPGIHVGEFAFEPVMYLDDEGNECYDEFETGSLMEDLRQELMDLPLVDDVVIHQWSSKSGTSIFLRVDTEPLFGEICVEEFSEYGGGYLHSIKETFDNPYKVICSAYKEYKKWRKDIEKMKKKAYKIIKGYAVGVRYACASNGESFFTSFKDNGKWGAKMDYEERIPCKPVTN